jgi:predicted translin family RNA/ssDNA-binding protein
MIDKKEFARIRASYKRFEAEREKTIQTSRQIITMSKQIIFALQRGDEKRAATVIKQMNRLVTKLPKEAYDTNIRRVAQQEYVEAMTFYDFITKGRIPTQKQLNVEFEEYLLGLCDLSGELVRKAVMSAIKGDIKQVRRIHDFIEELYSEFLKFDLRNGELRKKSDSIKWNLKKVDELLYDLRER